MGRAGGTKWRWKRSPLTLLEEGSLLADGDESPASLLGLHRHNSSRGFGVTYYILVRVRIHPAIVGMYEWVWDHSISMVFGWGRVYCLKIFYLFWQPFADPLAREIRLLIGF